MPAFVAALVVAPSLSSSTSSLFPLPSSSMFDRRKSISGGLAQPYREASSSPPPPHLQLPATTTLLSPPPISSFGSRPSTPGGKKRPGGGGRRSSTRPKTSESLGGGPPTAALLSSFPPLDPPGSSRVENGSWSGSRAGYSENLIDLLREAGIPVSTLRTTSQIQSHISLASPLPPTPTSPTPLLASSFSSSSHLHQSFSLPAIEPPPPIARSRSPSAQLSQAFILLLPLNDLAPSTLATAKLIKESGKTPSSICFDLEHEVGEKEWERTFVEALAVIEDVERKRGGWGKEVVVAAYSANPNLTPEAIQRCKRAGADAVIYPPFDEASRTIEQLQQALSTHREHFGSFSFDSPPSSRSHSQPRVGVDNPHSSSSSSHHPLSQLTSPPDTPPSPSFSFFTPVPTSPSTPKISRTQALPPPSSFKAFQSSLDSPRTPIASSSFSSVCAADPAGPRRASVDTGGLALALERAQKLEEDGMDDEMEEGDQAEEETVLAEVLSEMHTQTRSAIDGTRERSPSPLDESRRIELIREMSTWNFQPHKLSVNDLYHCACILFEATLSMEGLFELDIPLDQIQRLLFCVQSIYHAPNPYHNWKHAVDVLQASYSFLAAIGVVPSFEYLLTTRSGRAEEPWKRLPVVGANGREERAREILRPQDIFALMVAAIGHDVAHPGLSNVFMKNAKTPISQVYSDSSVLENMHCMLITSLLRKHGFDFLFPPPLPAAPDSSFTHHERQRSSTSGSPPLTPPLSDASHPPPIFPTSSSPSSIDWTDFRTILFSSILATDMAMHFGWIRELVELGERLAAEKESGVEGSFDEGSLVSEEELVKTDRIRICQAILKCADISNPTRPHEVSKHWSTVLLEEWANQAELESGLQLPVSVVKNADAALQAKGQLGFLDLFVFPLFSASATVMPQLSVYVTYCSDNRAIWENRLHQLTKDPSSPSLPIPPSSPTTSISSATTSISIPCEPNSVYRSLFSLTLPQSLLAGGLGSEDSVSSDGSTSTTSTVRGDGGAGRRAMKAGKRGGVDIGSSPEKKGLGGSSRRSESVDLSAARRR